MYKDYIEQYGEENVNIPDSAKYYMQKGYALRPELHSLLSENNYLYDYYNQLVEQGLTDSTSIKKADSVYYYLEKVNNKHQILLKKYNHHKNNFERIIKEYNDNL